MFCLFEFVRFEYRSTDVINEFFDLFSEHFYEINASMWATLRGRFVLPKETWKRLPPSMKKGKGQDMLGRKVEIDVPNGIIAHPTRELGGNVHDCHVVDITSGSFDKETDGANPHSGTIGTVLNVRRSTRLIWKLIHISVQLFARRKKIFLTRGTIGSAAISRRGGLCQLTTQSAQMVVARADRI
jgi:hypothetical protein